MMLFIADPFGLDWCRIAFDALLGGEACASAGIELAPDTAATATSNCRRVVAELMLEFVTMEHLGRTAISLPVAGVRRRESKWRMGGFSD
ncbi:MAG: hypothetical protein SFV20_08620 [Sphingopyxis sp.]|nr:hypothetical protein [Sphingopyxis sp.]